MKLLGREIHTKIADRLFPGGSRYLVLFVNIFRIGHLKREDWAYQISKVVWFIQSAGMLMRFGRAAEVGRVIEAARSRNPY